MTSHILVTILANYMVIILTVDGRIKGEMIMLKNMGSIDRFIRIVIGIAAIILALLVADGAWGIVLWVVAAIMLVTAVFGSCIIYRPFGISTCTKK